MYTVCLSIIRHTLISEYEKSQMWNQGNAVCLIFPYELNAILQTKQKCDCTVI